MDKKTENKNKHLFFIYLFSIIVILSFIFLPKLLTKKYTFENPGIFSDENVEASENKFEQKEKEIIIPNYVRTPESVRGLYMTSWVAGTPSMREGIVKLIDETEINSVVIDIKDYTGKIVFRIEDEKLSSYGSQEVRVSDMRKFIEELHSKNIYVIGRLSVFQDVYFANVRPDLAVKNKEGNLIWKDRKGLPWIDPGNREYWQYIVEVAKEARRIGFDEINFDYIRFPSDGNMSDISYDWASTTPRTEVLEDFFRYLNRELIGGDVNSDDRVKISADLFGMVTTARNDMGIGQMLEVALPYFDYIMPMVYPSHYPPNYQGYKNPADYPYEIVKYDMASAISRAELASTSPHKLRPWLQDFNLGATYDAVKVKAQIQATYDVGLNSWILWSPSNKYTRGALEME